MIITSRSAGYGGLAEFHDLFMADAWDRLAHRIATEFGALDSRALVVDIGAGSGVGTRTLARATDARILAVEPDLVMRSILLARVSDDDALVDRVSVLAGAVPRDIDQLPLRIDGFVCAHVLGHLSPADRYDLFAALSARLTGGAAGLITVASERTRSSGDVTESRRVGAHEYRAIHRAHPEPNVYSSRYEVWDGNVLLRSAEFTGTWTPIALDDLRSELDALDLRFEELEPTVVRVTKGRS